jgi:pyruvate dehydrogenase E2 component (dihydrolipoamide acetyltransferase)
MPALELTQETGRVLQWLKSDGDLVTQGEPIIEIETDKVTIELEAEASGYLMNISAEPGAEVSVGSVIAKIWAEDEIKHGIAHVAESALDSASSATAAHQELDTRKTEISTAVAPSRHVSEAANTAVTDTPAPVKTRLPSSPKARRLAAEQGIDLGSVSGPAGRPVLAADLHEAGSGKALSDEKPEMNRTWRIMAERLTGAWTSIPHFYLTREVDATKLVALKQSVQSSVNSKMSVSDLLVHKVASCLRDHPRLNTLWESGGPQVPVDINIGLAVALEEGLIVPVIHHADRMPLAEITQARTEIVRRAQSGKLRPEDLAGGTFTISNLGMYGVDSFQAIVNPPQAAILAVGRIVERVVAVNGSPTVRPAMTLTLSCDHRLVDGLRGAKFLLDLVNALEALS